MDFWAIDAFHLLKSRAQVGKNEHGLSVSREWQINFIVAADGEVCFIGH